MLLIARFHEMHIPVAQMYLFYEHLKTGSHVLNCIMMTLEKTVT